MELVKIYNGTRNEKVRNGKSVTIFLISFIYPANTGYLKRAALLLFWANQFFEKINIIIPVTDFNIAAEILEPHLQICDQLSLIISRPVKSRLDSAFNFARRLLTGRFVAFYSGLFLDRLVIKSFKKAIKQNEATYFLNTRHNYAGLVKYIPDSMIPVIDTQDIYTDIFRKYSVTATNPLLKKILTGYREKGDFIQSEIEILKTYKKIIAISEIDYRKYKSIPGLTSQLYKIESADIVSPPQASALSNTHNFDLLMVGSNFSGTQKGFEWLVKEVAPHLQNKLSLAVAGSLGQYIQKQNLASPQLAITVLGVVESVDVFYAQSRVVIIPIPEGTGTSIKGLEAMCQGAAIVSTTAGVRFESGHTGTIFLKTDDPVVFARYIQELLADNKKRETLGKNAYQFAAVNFSRAAAVKQLNRVFAEDDTAAPDTETN